VIRRLSVPPFHLLWPYLPVRGAADPETRDQVSRILEAVRQQGDEAIREYTREFDRVDLTPGQWEVKAQAVHDAVDRTAPEIRVALTHAVDRVRSYHEQQRGAGFRVTEPDGTVLEAPTSTIFWVDSEGGIHTPAIEVGILASITRDRIMKVAPVEESDSYQLNDVLEASEAFLASSLREVQGIALLDELEFTCPGPVTQRVAGLLSERIEAELSGALQLEGA